MPFIGDEHEDSTANTSGPGRGYRTDLRALHEDGLWLPEREEIRRIATNLAWGRGTGAPCPTGTTAYQVSKFAECSKEWARKVLLEMVKDGTMKIQKHGQLHLFLLIVPEVKDEVLGRHC